MKARRWGVVRKLYPIDQSPLYAVKGLGQLEQALQAHLQVALDANKASSYRVFVNDKDREIQAPRGALNRIHRRIAALLARIETPDYLYSKRGRSHLDNAGAHRRQPELLKTDIKEFYPGTTHAMVTRMFRRHFHCANDVSRMLADVCCFNGFLPTGSSLSGFVAFWCTKDMFDELHLLASSKGLVITVFADDITISGHGATSKLLWRARQIIHKHGRTTKRKKSRSYGASQAKPVTGAILRDGKMLLPNSQHLKIRTTRQKLAACDDLVAFDGLLNRLAGQLTNASTIEKHSGRLP